MAGAGAAKGAGEGRKSDHRGEVSRAIGVRSHRELIIMGELPELGDLLMQRLKALETSLVGSNWISARHQELIPPQAASLSSESERRRAAKQEAASLKRSKSPEQVRRVHFDDRPREIGRQGGAKEKPGGLSSAKQRRSAARLAEGDMAEEAKGLERSQESDSGSESSEEGFEALPAKSNPEESDGDWESLRSVDLEAGVEESLAIMQRWLKSEECGGLSISQTGGLLALVCM